MKEYMIKSFFVVIAVFAVIALIDLSLGGNMAYMMAAGVVPIGFAPLTWPAGSENGGGFKGKWLYIPEALVKKVPMLPEVTAESEIADYVTAKGAFEFKDAAGKPKYCYATDKTIGYTFESQGEIDGKSYKQSCEAFFPGNKVEAAAFARYVNNNPGYLVFESKDGQQILMGQPGLPVHITVSGDYGKALADRRGFTFKGEAESFVPMIVLGTPIDMDAILNPTTPSA